MKKSIISGFIGGVIGFIIYFAVFSHKGFDTYNEGIIYVAIWSIIFGVGGSIFSVILYKKRKINK